MQVKFYKNKDDVLYFLTFDKDKFVLEESKNWQWRKRGGHYYIKRIEKYKNGKTKLDLFYQFGQNVFYEKSHAEVQLEILGKGLAYSMSLICPNCKTEYTWSGTDKFESFATTILTEGKSFILCPTCEHRILFPSQEPFDYNLSKMGVMAVLDIQRLE